VTRARLQALSAPAAFAALAAVLAAVAAVPRSEAAWAAASVLLAFVPSGWLAPGGWRRRGAEALLLVAACALALLPDPTMRRMALPPLLLLAGWAAAAAVPAGRARPWLAGCAGLAGRAAGGLGLAGAPPLSAALASGAALSAGVGVAQLASGGAGTVAALLAGVAPLQEAPALAAGVVAVGLLLRRFARPSPLASRIAAGWRPAVLAIAMTVATLSPWCGLSPVRALPAAGRSGFAAGLAAAVVTPWLPGPVGAAGWLLASLALGPIQPAPPDRAGVVLSAAAPRAALAPASGGAYIVETSLANAAALADGTVVAHIRAGGAREELRAGRETAEWAHERPDVRGRIAHGLPETPVWRPAGGGAATVWSVAGRESLRLPPHAPVEIERDPSLPPDVTVAVQTAGPSRPTPPRDWPLPRWLLAAAIVVAALQLGSGTWRAPAAALPWTLLAAFSVLARMPVEPLRLLGERYAVDVALAAVLAAWLPATRVWLGRSRVFLAAAALLVPLAIATPHLTPPLYGDEPFHLIVLDSLAHDHDLDLSNNYDLAHHPYNRIYLSAFIHSPVLAFLLLPGYLVWERTGALILLALAGAGVVALVARRAGQLGTGPPRRAMLVTLLLVTLPLATYSTQIWVEIPGALAAIASVTLLAAPRPRRATVAGLAALATAIKTRLALVVFPVAIVAWWPRRFGWREARRALAALGAATVVGIGVTWLTFGHPLGNRRLADLVPAGTSLPLRVVGGLLFDPAGGLAFSAPLLFLALGGAWALWKRAGNGERALITGGVATVLALLSSPEWYGGGSPPGRYLVPLLPVFALSGALVLRGVPRLRTVAACAVPPAVFVWWVLVTRPHFSVNPGDGGWWLEGALARRFAADARHLFPSFLRPSTATVVVPLVIVALLATALAVGRSRPSVLRGLARNVVALWLIAAAGLIVTLRVRTDHVVEIEDPQVVHLGGEIEPPPGTFSRFLHASGWRLRDGDGVEAPLNLPARATVRLEGWLDGAAQEGATLEVRWDGASPATVAVGGEGRGVVALPGVPGAGHHVLDVRLHAAAGGDAVLDRLVVAP
jgi:hypothetical protein